jgi:proteasome accessory factor C
MPNSHPIAQENLVLFLSLIPFVMDRGEVSIADAAEVFGRSPQDIRKAVELIACSGIPGDSRAYLHADLFDIDWDLFLEEEIIRFEHTIIIDSQPGFSAREMSALIAGLQYLAQHPAWANRPDIHRLLGKLSGTTDHLVVKSQPQPATLEKLQDAIARGVRVTMLYVNKAGERDERLIDPLAIESRDDVWFFRGWCHSRQALRTFRVDRIEAVELSQDPSDRHDDVLSPDQWSVFSPSPGDLMVTIEFPPQAVAIIAEYLDRHHQPVAVGSMMRAEVPFAHVGSLTRFAAKYPTLVEVIGPPEARDAVAGWASRALEQYS